jgi:hypothetical protein
MNFKRNDLVQKIQPWRACGASTERHNRKRSRVVVAIFCLFLLPAFALAQVHFETPASGPGVETIVPPPPELLDENCVISVLNRITRAKADGTWILPTVPANFGAVRARATCVRNGTTSFGQSDFFTLSKDQSVTLPQIILGNTSPIPTAITITGSPTSLTQSGQATQLVVTGTYANASTQNITAASSGTQYQVSNPAIVSVTSDGLVTALISGAAVIQALNEGAQGLLQIQVSLGSDSDGDGIPDDAELRLGLNPHDPTDALLDPDHDGLTNLQEFQLGTDPTKADSDGDGLLDGQEVLKYHSNPAVVDTDGDGIPDGVEVQSGSDPADSHSFFLNKALASLEAKPGNFTLTVNSIQGQASQQLSILGHLIDGKTTIDLTSTTKGTSYSSSDLNVCNFGSPDGNVFAGGNGSCTITISNNGFSAQSLGVVRAFTPTPLSFIAIPGFANSVDVNGDFAYVAAGSAGLKVVNVTDRTVPSIAASLPLAGNANDVKLIGKVAIVAAGSTGIHAVDVSTPTAPVLKNTLGTSGTAQDVVIAGNTAYVANGTNLFLADVTNPLALARISSLPLTGNIRGVAVDAKRKLVAVAAGSSGIYVIDISNPLSPFQRGQLALTDAHQVAIKGNYAFVANFHGTSVAYQSSIVAVDITNPAAPVIANSITNQSLGGNLNDVTIQGNFALSADVFFVNGIPITDISTPTSLQARATLNFPQRDDNGLGIAADGSYVYLTTDHSAIDKFGTTGDGRLYIGQYLALEDNKGIAPTVNITSPTANSTVVEGASITATVEATDDVGVSSVSLQVNGQTIATSTAAPFQLSFTVPTGASTVTIGATAVDLGGNVGKATDETLSVIPDPGTTVIGRVLNVGGPVSGASVTVNGGGSTTTGSDGRFTVSRVPTTLGNIKATVNATLNGSPVTLISAAVPAVLSGTTDVGDINLTPILINFDNIAGITAMGNSPGATVPTAARLGTQLQNSLGVAFTSGVNYVPVVALGVGHATSGANGIGGSATNNTLSYATPFTFTFSVPGDPATPAVTDFVSIRFDQAPGSGTATMDAFDVKGQPIGSVTKPDSAGGTISLALRGIHSVRVSETQANIAFDDLGYDPLGSAYADDHTSPTARITSVDPNATLVQGSQLLIQVTASDDLALKSVSISVNGQVIFTGANPLFQATYTVPLGTTTVTIDATALDFNGNVGNAPQLVLNAIPDPGTTVVGRVLDSNQVPIAGATATTLGVSAVTGPDGTFSITGVSTIAGNIAVSAVVHSAGQLKSGSSSLFTPNRGGQTNVGDILALSRNMLVVGNFNSLNATAVNVGVTPPAVAATLNTFLQPYGVAITPDGRTALITNQDPNNNFAGSVRFVDLTTTPPALVGSAVGVGSEAWTTAITKNGKFAITIGGNGVVGSEIVSINIATRSVITRLPLVASSLAILNDSRTVLIGDPNNQRYLIYNISDTGVLTDTGVRVPHTERTQIGHIALSPNGKLALVPAGLGQRGVWILRIDAQGNITEDSTPLITCPAPGPNVPTCGAITVAFSPDGSKAYVVDVSYASGPTSFVAVLNIDQNGNVTDSGIRIPNPNGSVDYNLATIPQIAMGPDGRAYISNVVIFTPNVGTTEATSISVLDTNLNQITGTISVGRVPRPIDVPK